MRTLFAIAICIGLSGCRDSDRQGEGINSESQAPAALVVRTWSVPADFMQRLLEGPPRQAANDTLDGFFGVIRDNFYSPLPDMFEYRHKIPFPPDASMDFSPNRGLLVVKNTVERLQAIDEVIESLGPMDHFVLDRHLFHPLGRLALNDKSEVSSRLITSELYLASEVMDRFLSLNKIDDDEPGADPFSDTGDTPPKSVMARRQERSLPELFTRSGIGMPEGALVNYDPSREVLTIVNTKSETFKTEVTFLDIAIAMADEKKAESGPRE